jgi:hypothetical protein
VNEGLEMPGMDAAMGTLTVPIWAAGAASALFVVAVILAIGKAGAAAGGRPHCKGAGARRTL